jgi:hypothetical protein
MRRILRKLAVGDIDELGDVSTLADPLVVDDLIAGIKSKHGLIVSGLLVFINKFKWKLPLSDVVF